MSKWVPLIGFEELYEVSDYAEIRNRKTGEIMQQKKGSGYNSFIVYLKGAGKKRTYSVARLVYESFRGKLPDDMVVIHDNGVLADNEIYNLTAVHRRTMSGTTGKYSNSHIVMKIAPDGEVVDYAPSIMEMAKREHMHYHTMMRYVHNVVKDPYYLTGYRYKIER